VVRRILLLVLLVALAAGACSSGNQKADLAPSTKSKASSTTAPSAASIDWQDCGDGYECGTVEVPRDHAQPDGPTIEVAVGRLAAEDPEQRIGSLVLNPGGPGVPGVSTLRDLAPSLPDEIGQKFDLVAWDPRGTGETIPVHCEVDMDEVVAVDPSPDDAAERKRLVEVAREQADGCEKASGDVLPYVSSEQTVQDLEAVRVALGEGKLNYLGYSYGTYLGARYAERYPTKIRTMVLDSAVDPSLTASDVGIEQAEGFEANFETFLDWCANNRDCAIYNDGDPGAFYDDLAKRVDAQPIDGGGGRTLGSGEFSYAVAQAGYYGKPVYQDLATALADAADGDPDVLLQFADLYTGRQADGTYDSDLSAFWAIGCVDSTPYGGPEKLFAIGREAARRAPRFGPELVGLGMVCEVWPVPPDDHYGRVSAAGAPPILVIGNTGDPATPYGWAQGLSDQLESAVLLTLESNQHTAFGTAGSACVDVAVTKYLIDRDPPPAGTDCT